jgi:nanoRNase/pAp phosphatase (c-di-AMP/oligoRNAs hydrolase)
MENQFAKAAKLINESKNILIIPREEICGDALGSAIALYKTLRETSDNKTNFDIYLPEAIPPQLHFLLDENEIEKSRLLSKNLVISINNESNGINSLYYKKQNGKFNVIISLQDDKKINENDLKIETSTFNYDLIITIGAQNLTLLGRIYENHPDFFSKTPIINIDYQQDNWQFGNVNIIDDKSASIAEIIMEFTNFINCPPTKERATCLLCGIIEKTQTFQKPNTTPRILRMASELINSGGNQELIVRHLYKTKSMNTVKLWGEIMKELKYDQHKKIASSLITQEILRQSNADPSIFKQLLKELWINFAKCNHFFILWSSENNINGIFTSKKPQIIKEANNLIESKIKDDYLIFQLPEKNLYRAESFFFNLINGII